jgi:predicted TIM-barrel fold metal-dependent hydrolase
MIGAGATMFGLGGSAALAQYEKSDNHWGWGDAPNQNLPASATNGPWRNLRAVKEKKVFDLHVHSYETPHQGHNYRDAGAEHAKDHYVNYVNELIASMDRHGVAQCALNPAFTTFEEVYETSYLPHKDRFVLTAGSPTVELKKRMTVQGGAIEITPAEVAALYEQQVKKYGVKMIGETAGSLTRNLIGKYTTKDLRPIVDVLMKYDLPLQIHTGWTPTGTARDKNVAANYQSASDWAEVMGKFMANYPDVKTILAHMGGQFGELDGWEAVRLLYSFDNCYCDTAKAPAFIIQAAVKGIGAEKVMFGSDWNRPEMKEYGPYFYRSAYQHWHNLNAVANAEMTEDQRDWVLYKSARKLLKLDKA